MNPNGYKEAFGNAEELLVTLGIPRAQIFNPALHDTPQYGFTAGTNAEYRYYLEMDLTWICKYATHMYLLKNWELSPGANAEHALAKALKLEFWYET